MGKATYKVENGKMIKVSLEDSGGKIQEIKITGDFFLHPEEFIEVLEHSLVGLTLEKSNLLMKIKNMTKKHKVVLIGATIDDLVQCIINAKSSK